jgi:flagellar motor switch protein FliN/FliY
MLNMVAADEKKTQPDSPPTNAQEKSPKTPADPKDKSYRDLKRDEASDVQATVKLDFILDIPIEVTVELGRTKMLVNELLKLGQGSVVELSKLAGETLEILANQKLIARGEVVVVNEKYGVRLTEVITPTERIERLR